MKTAHLSILLFSLLFSFTCHAQIRFEEGYFITNSGNKTPCLIKNIDWKNNPTEFEYKLNETATPAIATIEEVQEFGFLNSTKYQRLVVSIDRSSENLNSISTSRDPEFSEERLFLKVLVEGPASLYAYEDKTTFKRYFYQVENSGVKQLVYKKYLIVKGNARKIAKNELYKQQLWHEVRCESTSMKQINKLDYFKDELIEYFTNYNTCNASTTSTTVEEKQRPDFFQFRLTPGINWASLSFENVVNTRDPNFSIQPGIRLGVEAEFVLPFNKNKWSLFAEPMYQQYKAETQIYTRKATVNYQSIEFLVGVRHYFFLTDKSKIFLNGAYITPFDKDSDLRFENESKVYTFDPAGNFAVGVGYSYNSRYGIELRSYSNRKLLNYFDWKSRYSNVSLVLGLKIF